MGGPGTRLQTIWKGMKRRCQSPGAPSYRFYGERGIKVCPEWQTFVGFLDWALLAGYRNDQQLDRIDADGDYCAANCRWVPAVVNAKRRELPRTGEYLAALCGTLTPTTVEAAVGGDRPVKLWDGDGLYLLVNSTGTKVWRLKYRFDGRERLLTIGRYPTLSLEQARELAAVTRSQVRRGRDPALLKREAARKSTRRAAGKIA